MKTNFFQIIAQLKSTGSWTIHISPETNDRLIVSVLLSDPKSNKEGINLTPMIFNETPKVLDETLFSLLTTPVKQANEMFTNVAVFQKSMEEAKKALEAKMKAKSADTSKVAKKDFSSPPCWSIDQVQPKREKLNVSLKPQSHEYH